MRILEVKDRESWKLFHKTPHIVYRHNEVWICPLESDIEKIFNPATNKTFQNGIARLWVLLDDSSMPVGRIAAFIDKQRNLQQSFPTGGIGFFECIDNEEYAKMLFDVAEQYLIEEGVQAIDGPINFGEREKFWGLLVKGHEFAPLYQENYHPPYYKRFFESLAYRPYEQMLTMKGIVAEMPAERLDKLAQRVRERYGLKTRYIDPGNLPLYADHMRQVYNEAFRNFPYFKPLHTHQILDMLKQLRVVMDKYLVCFAYEGEQPVGFIGIMPDINEYLKPVKGKLSLWELPGFLWRLRTAKVRVAKGVVFGIHPDFHRKGVFPLMISFLHTERNTSLYSTFYMPTIRGHNKMMVESAMSLGVKPQRVHVAYRKLLDDQLPFTPFDFMEV